MFSIDPEENACGIEEEGVSDAEDDVGDAIAVEVLRAEIEASRIEINHGHSRSGTVVTAASLSYTHKRSRQLKAQLVFDVRWVEMRHAGINLRPQRRPLFSFQGLSSGPGSPVALQSQIQSLTSRDSSMSSWENVQS